MGAFGMHSDPEGREFYLRNSGLKKPDHDGVALTADELKMVDAWIERHPDPKPSRPEAVHRLLICALSEHPGQ